MIELKSRSRSARFLTATVLRGVVLAGLTFVAACGKGDGPTDPGPDPVDDLSGAWTLNITFGNAAVGLSCDTRTQVRLHQSGASVSAEFVGGTTTCTAQGETASNEPTGTFSGTVEGDKVTFQLSGARLTGRISSDLNRMEGTLSGSFDGGEGQQLDLSGNWSATR